MYIPFVLKFYLWDHFFVIKLLILGIVCLWTYLIIFSCFPSAWNWINSSDLLQDRRKGRRKERKKREEVSCRKKVWYCSQINPEPAYFTQFLLSKWPQMGYFQNCFVNLGLHFYKMAWFGWTTVVSVHMQIAANMSRNFFIVITIQCDTPASGWKFLQLHSSLFIISQVIIKAIELGPRSGKRLFGGTPQNQLMTIPLVLWTRKRKFWCGSSVLEKVCPWHQTNKALSSRFWHLLSGSPCANYIIFLDLQFPHIHVKENNDIYLKGNDRPWVLNKIMHGVRLSIALP